MFNVLSVFDNYFNVLKLFGSGETWQIDDCGTLAHWHPSHGKIKDKSLWNTEIEKT